MDDCQACGKCCEKHWLLRLIGEREISLFGDDVVYGSFIWVDQCKYNVDGKCTIHEDKPHKCKEYFCEGYFEKLTPI